MFGEFERDGQLLSCGRAGVSGGGPPCRNAATATAGHSAAVAGVARAARGSHAVFAHQGPARCAVIACIIPAGTRAQCSARRAPPPLIVSACCRARCVPRARRRLSRAPALCRPPCAGPALGRQGGARAIRGAAAAPGAGAGPDNSGPQGAEGPQGKGQRAPARP